MTVSWPSSCEVVGWYIAQKESYPLLLLSNTQVLSPVLLQKSNIEGSRLVRRRCRYQMLPSSAAGFPQHLSQVRKKTNNSTVNFYEAIDGCSLTRLSPIFWSYEGLILTSVVIALSSLYKMYSPRHEFVPDYGTSFALFQLCL